MSRFKAIAKASILSAPIVLSFAFTADSSATQSDISMTSDTSSLMDILDTNNDIIVDPFEALDALLTVENEIGHAPSRKELNEFLTAQKKEALKEYRQFIAAFDRNRNEIIDKQELERIEDEQAAWFFEAMDANKDGAVTSDEAFKLDLTSAYFSSEEDIKKELKEVFNERDADNDGVINLQTEGGGDEEDRIWEYDLNGDNQVAREEARRAMRAINRPATFEIKGDTAHMEGVITAALPAAVLRLLFEHPEVTTIEMQIVPGSLDDEANLRAALYIRRQGLGTRLNANSSIASGGTDFFLAGVTRSVEKGAKIGVHSWGGPLTATEVPRDDPIHQGYLDYYEAVGIPEAFYWFTLESAPAEDMHMMTEEEIDRYKVRTEPAAP